MLRIRDCRKDGVRALWAFVRVGDTIKVIDAAVGDDADSN